MLPGKRFDGEDALGYVKGLLTAFEGFGSASARLAPADAITATSTHAVAAATSATTTSAVDVPKNGFLLVLNIAFPLPCPPYRYSSCRGASRCGASSYLARLSGARRPLLHAWDALL